jgi:hypothetical protein
MSAGLPHRLGCPISLITELAANFDSWLQPCFARLAVRLRRLILQQQAT